MPINNNTNILTSADQFGKFHLLDYLERLEIVDETGYHIEILCPACKTKNFKITKETGQYFSHECQCMSSEEGKKDVIKAVLGPDWKDYSYSPYSQVRSKSTNQQKAQSAEISKIESSDHGLCANLKGDVTVTLGKLEQIPEDYPKPVKGSYIPKDIIATANKAGATRSQIEEITYQYSPTQFVKRFQWPDQGSSKGQSKSFRQCHINDQGKTVWKKGEADWPLYRQAEAIKTKGWPLFQEGEKCVEASRSLGIASITTQGGNWDKANLSKSLKALQDANVPGIVFIGDNDEAGVKKAVTLLQASLDLDFPVIVIPINKIWPEAPEAGDLADWITWGKTNNMYIYDRDYISRMEDEIHRAVNERQRLSALPAIPELTKGQKLKLEIKAWQQETDVAERETRKVEICCEFKVNARAFDAIAHSLELDYNNPKHNKHKISNFMGLPTKGTPILAPGIPAIGVTILAGLPGTGKTTLAYDLAGAVLMGDEFLGEVPTQKGSVLFLACDEPYAHVQDKFINRGIANVESHLGTIITDWTVQEWYALESTVDEMRPSLVVVDSFNGIHEDDSFDENSAAASNTIKKLEKLSSRYGVPIVVIHHINKSKENRGVNKLRGSSAIAASCSSILILEGTEGTHKTLSQPKIRGSEPINLTLEADFEFGRFKVVSGNLADEKTKSLAQRLHDFFLLNADTMFEITELRERFPNEDRKVLTNSVNRLVNRGNITKRPSKGNLRAKVYGIGCTDNPPAIDFHTPPPPEPLKEFDDNLAETIDIKGIEPVITVSSPLSSIPETSVITEEIKVVTEQVMTLETVVEKEIQLDVINFDHQGGGSVNQVDDDNEAVLTENQQITEETEEEAQPQDWNELIKEMDAHIEQLGWTKEEARSYVQVTYGKKSRLKLTDAELLEFRNHLKLLVKATE